MNRRIIAVLVALVLAVVGTGAVFAYTQGADARALAKTRAVTVYVAAKRVPAGTTVQDAVNGGLMTPQRLPAGSVPDNTVSEIGQGMGALVSVADIQPGQVILRQMFDTKAPAKEPLAIPAGQVALAVQLTVPQAVSAYVRPGSQIAVFDTYPSDGQGQPVTAKDAPQVTRMVLPRVDVIQVGAYSTNSSENGSQQSQANTTTVLVTVAVTQDQAEQLIQAQAVGTLYLALLAGASTTTTDGGLNNQHLFH